MRLSGMVTAVDAHAGGEPGGVMVGGVLDVRGKSMFEKRLFLERHRDDLRKRMLREPRGYPGLCCNLILPPTLPEADAGFVIMEQTPPPADVGQQHVLRDDGATRDGHFADARAGHRDHARGAGGADSGARGM